MTQAEALQPDPLIGSIFDGKYRIEERLGHGGMGTVYRATHLKIERSVAVKVLHTKFVDHEVARARFEREARAAGRVNHPNAVSVTDFGETEDGYLYLVMEMLEGQSLRDALLREAPLDPARAVALMLQIASAVDAAHEAGVIHRDLKPANIFIAESKGSPPIVKVLDFGIAKFVADALNEDNFTLTNGNGAIGTPRYMSPEQCEGDSLTPAADVYSLGVIFYEMLAGVTPFSGNTISVAVKHATEPPRPPRELVPTIPLPLEDLTIHALAKVPEHRPANAGQFRAELAEAANLAGLEHETIPSFEAIATAGRRTPSGRLVLDINRLREYQAELSHSQEFNAAEPRADDSRDAPLNAGFEELDDPNSEPSAQGYQEIAEDPPAKKSATKWLLLLPLILGLGALSFWAVTRMKWRQTVPDAVVMPTDSVADGSTDNANTTVNSSGNNPGNASPVNANSPPRVNHNANVNPPREGANAENHLQKRANEPKNGNANNGGAINPRRENNRQAEEEATDVNSPGRPRRAGNNDAQPANRNTENSNQRRAANDKNDKDDDGNLVTRPAKKVGGALKRGGGTLKRKIGKILP